MKRLVVLLLIAMGLRLGLIAQGGQFYIPDEERVKLAQYLVGTNTTDDALSRIRRVLPREHTAYTLLAAPSAWLWAQFTDPIMGEKAAASLLALCSVTIIALVYGIARQTGASEDEAFVAAVFMTASSSLFYFARHFVPYDGALMLGLMALWVSMRPRLRLIYLFLSGMLLCSAFLVYNGYWLLISVIGILLTVYDLPDSNRERLREIGRRVVRLAGGASVILLVMWGVALALDVPPTYTVQILISFSGTITHGALSEGWSLPWEYLWHAEHGLLVVWLVGVALTIQRLRAQRQGGRAWYWVLAIVLLYGGLVITSTVLQRFVVYGRLARPLVPFLALAAAYSLTPLLTGMDRRAVWLRRGLAVFLIAQTAWNFYTPLTQVFPRAFEAAHRDNFPSIEYYNTIRQKDVPSSIPNARYLFVNTFSLSLHFIVGSSSQPEGRVLDSAPNPLAYGPYLYEGYGPETRAILRSGITTMMLLEQDIP